MFTTRKVLAGAVSGIMCLSMLAASVAADVAVANSPKYGDIKVDGQLDDAYWAAATWYPIDKPIQKADGSKDQSDVANNVGNFATAWDDNNLYIAVEVQDNILVTDPNGLDTSIYNHDGIEIFVDGDNDKTITSIQDFNDIHLFFSASTNDFQAMGQNWAWIDIATDMKDIAWKIVTDDDGYNVEVSIPWSLLAETPAADKEIGFLVTMNDDDDAASWAGSDRIEQYWGLSEFNSNSPATWNNLKLEGDFKMPEPVVDTPADTADPSSSANTFDLTAVAAAAAALSAAALAVSKKKSR